MCSAMPCLLHVHQREGEIPPAAAVHRLVDPDHGERLQEARVLQRASIDRFETELADELHHRALPAGIVAGDQHERLDRVVGRFGHIAGPRRVERLQAEGARRPVRDLLAGRGVEAEDNCKPSGPMPNGFMQSITVLPARLPRLLTAASAADQGVAITTTSAALTASAGALTRSLGSAACFGSAGLRSPQITSSPRSIQARPSVAPTDPAPMIAIRMTTSIAIDHCVTDITTSSRFFDHYRFG